MESSRTRPQGTTIHDWLRVLQRRKWVVALPLVGVPLVALLIAFRQQRVYEASADVFLSNQNLASTVSGIPQAAQDPDRYAQTQVDLARVPTVAVRVLRTTGVRTRTPATFLKESNVFVQPSADLLSFVVRDNDPRLATKLANAYARVFTAYRRQLDTASMQTARAQVEQRLAQFTGPPPRRSPLYDTYASLVQREEQLRTMEALQGSNALLVRQATNAVQVRPSPKRDAAIGLGLGLLLGLGLALLWHALDTRVRSGDELADGLGLPLLGRIPAPPRRLRRSNEPAMLAEPSGAQAEAFRMLRTNVDFVNLKARARVIMITSALEGEGKTTTAVNLAIAFARAGRRVVLIDLDLRRPALSGVFAVNGRPGLIDVALGEASPDEARVAIQFASASTPRGSSRNGGSRQAAGMLEVVVSGGVPPDPGEFVASDALDSLLAELGEGADLIVLDAPPLLHVGDAAALSAKADGVILVTRLNMARRPLVSEVRRVLDSLPARPLGFVVTGAELEDGYAAGSYYYGRRLPDAERQPPAQAPVNH